MKSIRTFTVFAQLGKNRHFRVTIGSLVLCCAAAVLFCAPDAAAVLTMGHISDGALDGLVSAGGGYAAVGGSCKSILFAVIAEDNLSSQSSRFGIFDYEDPSRRLEIFAGADASSGSVTVKFEAGFSEAWIEPHRKVNIGPVFGFYLDSTAEDQGGIFYSDAMLNSGPDSGVSHAELFDTGAVLQPGVVPDLVVGFEDSAVGTPGFDGDCEDFIVAVKRVTCVIPEPAALAILGLGSALLLRRRPG